MNIRILISLSLLFLLYCFGVFVSIKNIDNTTGVLHHLVNLHKVEGLRSNLVQRVVRVNSDLYAYTTPYARGLDEIIGNVENLDNLAAECSSCHHAPETLNDLDHILLLIEDFKNTLSFYMTASADSARIERLRSEAARSGDALLLQVESMAFKATRGMEKLTLDAFRDIERSKNALYLFVFLAGFFGLAIALHLARSITKPTRELVDASRRIAGGELGYVIPGNFREEFGELARCFNAMSRTLKNSFSDLEREIAERRQTEQALRQSEERYALAARGANDGLWDWDLLRGTIYFSPRWKAMLGYREKDFSDKPEDWFKLVHSDDLRTLENRIALHLEGAMEHVECECRMLHADGGWRWMLIRGVAVRDPDGRPYRMAGSQTDITERKTAEAQLVHDAFHDALTHLPNRALFSNRVDHAIQAAQRRPGFLFAVLFLDLDRFKFINDSLGHYMGDRLLVVVAERLRHYVRPSDTVARLGGDEFAILLEDIHDTEEAVAVARRIKKELPQPMEIDGHEIFVSASIGISLSSAGYQNPDQILRDADLAMYHAKARGKARYEIFDPAMHDHTVAHLQLENDLRRAIEREEFCLKYQPVVDVSSEQVVGFEVLIRWNHPSRGLLMPNEFIPMAEDSGLLPPIGKWVLRNACKRLNVWRRMLDDASVPYISVNLSGREFTQALVDTVREIVEKYKLPSGSLNLEITERTIMEAPESAAALLLVLKKLGVGLQIDDFGTGYSSLGYLPHFPVDTLKIDRSFIMDIDAHQDNYQIVRTIIALARNLRMRVVGEGVERSAELDLLRALGCGFIQGNIFYEALDAEQADALVGRMKDFHEARRCSP